MVEITEQIRAEVGIGVDDDADEVDLTADDIMSAEHDVPISLD